MSKEIKYVQEQINDYILTHSGKKFYILNPNKKDISVEDISHALSNLCRYTGHIDRFYSVGEHSIMCAIVAKKMGLSELQQIYALGHDASESVVNDLARPVKQHIHQYKEIEDKVMSVMWEVLGVPEPTEEDYHIVKLIDNTVLLHEMRQLFTHRELPDVETVDVDIDLGDGFHAGGSKFAWLAIYDMLIASYRKKNEGVENIG